MMSLYMNNFRGFADTWVPIRDGNFLVGENSTGKSSLLALDALFSKAFFWYEPVFNTEDVALGSFDDIVSVDANDRSYFEVGYLNTFGPPKQGRPPRVGVHIRFTESKSLPAMQRVHVLFADSLLRIAFRPKSIAYGLGTISSRRGTDLISTFNGWIAQGSPRSAYPKSLKGFPIQAHYLLTLVDYILHSHGRHRRIMRPSMTLRQSIQYALRYGVGPISAKWIAPIRSEPRRVFAEVRPPFSSQGAHVPYLIRSIKGTKAWRELRNSLCEFGQKSGLFRTLDVRQFGTKPDSPFSLDFRLGDAYLNLGNVGYGVSQSLPVVVELLLGRQQMRFAIQQPEIHIHPRAQAAFGELLFKLATKEHMRFLVETHSDFIIDRFRSNYRTAKKKPDAQVLFFERTNRGNKVSALAFTKNGEYPKDQPRSFRSFFLKEQLDLLGG
ncbi:ATP-binding protein [Candidatus Bathyarchaeota archaeon]|nr:ATP-binding protein [Candidatus Bathyarchaeota archaeon]